MSNADVARRNGWVVGTRLAGDEGYGETIIEITAMAASSSAPWSHQVGWYGTCFRVR